MQVLPCPEGGGGLIKKGKFVTYLPPCPMSNLGNCHVIRHYLSYPMSHVTKSDDA